MYIQAQMAFLRIVSDQAWTQANSVQHGAVIKANLGSTEFHYPSFREEQYMRQLNVLMLYRYSVPVLFKQSDLAENLVKLHELI